MKKKLNLIYLMHSIEGFAGSLIGIFVPVQMLRLGFSIFDILLYYIVFYATILLFLYLGGCLSEYIGLKKLFVIRLPFLFAKLFLLYGLAYDHSLLFALAFLTGIEVALYWLPLHVFFASHSKQEQMGGDVGKLFALPQLVSILSPLLGGLIMHLFGFKFLIGCAIAVYLSMLYPLARLPELGARVGMQLSEVFGYFRKYRRYFAAETLINISDEVQAVILPIYIYLAFKSVLSVGALGTILGLGGIFFTLFVGRQADRVGPRKLLRAGAIILALLWAALYLNSDPGSFFMIMLLISFFGSLISIPFHSIIYNTAKRERASEFILFREIAVVSGRMIAFIFALVFIGAIKLNFLLPPIAYLLFLFF